MSVRSGIETWACGVVSKAERRDHLQSVTYMITTAGHRPDRKLNEAVRKVLRRRGGWLLTGRKFEGRQLWRFIGPRGEKK